jgi:hypothetical protein
MDAGRTDYIIQNHHCKILNFQLKMHQKRLAAELLPYPLGKLKYSPRAPNSTERATSVAAAYMRFSAGRRGKIKVDGAELEGEQGRRRG